MVPPEHPPAPEPQDNTPAGKPETPDSQEGGSATPSDGREDQPTGSAEGAGKPSAPPDGGGEPAGARKPGAPSPAAGAPGASPDQTAAGRKPSPAARGDKPGDGEPTETLPAAGGDKPGEGDAQPTETLPATAGDSGEKPATDADQTAAEGGNADDAGKPGDGESTEALPAASGGKPSPAARGGKPSEGDDQPTETLPATAGSSDKPGDDQPTEALPATAGAAAEGSSAEGSSAEGSSAEGDQPTESLSPAGEGEPGKGDDKPTEALPAVSPPTRKSNTRLLIAIGLAVLVLVGGGITIIALATQNRPEDLALQKSKAEARGVVEKFAVLFAQARNDGAFSLSKSDVKALLCSREQDALDQEWTERETKEINRSSAPPTPAARLELTIKDINIQGDAGVATLTGTIADRKTDQDFGLVKEQGLWKVCDVVFRIPRSSSSSNPTTPSNVETGTTPPDFPTGPVGENPGGTITTTTTETR